MSNHRFQRYSDRFFLVVRSIQSRVGICAQGKKVIGPFPTREAAELALMNIFGTAATAIQPKIEPTGLVSEMYSPGCRVSQFDD